MVSGIREGSHMSRPIEVDRFAPYLKRYGWHIVHEPKALEPKLIPGAQGGAPGVTYLVCLPSVWTDAARVHKTAVFIAADILLRLQREYDLNITWHVLLPTRKYLLDEIADRLIVPSIWLDVFVKQHGCGAASRRQ